MPKKKRRRRKRIFAIDPGTYQSGYCVLEVDHVSECDIVDNEQLLRLITCGQFRGTVGVIEMIANYGMPAGAELFETAVWIGRFREAYRRAYGLDLPSVYRKDVKLHLCNTNRCGNPHVRQALIDRFKPTGGGARPQIGTKAEPGPLYGVRSHIWAALAVAVFSYDTNVV